MADDRRTTGDTLELRGPVRIGDILAELVPAILARSADVDTDDCAETEAAA